MAPWLLLLSHVLSIAPLHTSQVHHSKSPVPDTFDLTSSAAWLSSTTLDLATSDDLLSIDIDLEVQPEQLVPSTSSIDNNNNVIATIDDETSSPHSSVLATPGQLIYIITIAGITVTACLLLIKFRCCVKHKSSSRASDSDSPVPNMKKAKPLDHKSAIKRMFHIGSNVIDEEYEDDLHDIVTMHDPYEQTNCDLSNICSPRTPESTTIQSPYSMVSIAPRAPMFKLSICENVNAVYKSPSVLAVAPSVAMKMSPWYHAHAAYVMNSRGSKPIPVALHNAAVVASEYPADDASIASPAGIGSRSRDISRYTQYSEGGEPQRKITRIDENSVCEEKNNANLDLMIHKDGAFTQPPQPGLRSPPVVSRSISRSPLSPNLPPYVTTNGVAADEFVVHGGEDSEHDENVNDEQSTLGNINGARRQHHQYGESVNSDDEVVVDMYAPTPE